MHVVKETLSRNIHKPDPSHIQRMQLHKKGTDSLHGKLSVLFILRFQAPAVCIRAAAI